MTRWLGHGVAMLAFLLLLVAPAAPAEAAPSRSAPALAATPIAPKSAFVPVRSGRAVPLRQRIDCTLRVTPKQARKLPRAIRASLRLRGAHWVPARRKARGRAAAAAHWICLRSPRDAATSRRLTRQLGSPLPTGSLQVQAVHAPSTLDGPLSIDLPSGASAGWRMLQAPAVRAQRYDRGLLYSTGEYDVVQQVGIGSLKESIAVYRRQGVRTWAWKLAHDGGEAPRLLPDGRVTFGTGVVIDPPFVENAGGRHVRDLEWKLDGTTLSVRVDDRALPLPYVIDPSSNYPARMYPLPNAVAGSFQIKRLDTALGVGPIDTASGASSELVGDSYVWSGVNTGYNPGFVIDDTTAPDPRNMNGIGICGGRTDCNGALGWSQSTEGGATLAAGPYTVQTDFLYVQDDNGIAGMPVTAALKVRLWKVRYAADGSVLAGSAVPITSWTTGSQRTWIQGEQVGYTKTMTASLTPLSLAARTLARQDHLFVEYAVSVSDPGKSGSMLRLNTRSANTFIDFGAASTNTPGTAANLRVASSPLTPDGWTTTRTPTLRANLDDPTWSHHIEYQICSDAACSTVVRTGNSPAGQDMGSTNDSWTVPSTEPLPDGTYYMRARTVEDGGDGQIGPWTNTTGTTCTAPNVGPCGSFRVDGTLPSGLISTAPAAFAGTATINGTSSDGTSGVASISVQWRRISPTAAGPSSAGLTCTGTTSWSCSWNTPDAGDGTYELILVVTDVAGNVGTITRSTYVVDNNPPTWPAGSYVRDGASAGDLTWATVPGELGSNWSAAQDTVGVSRYEYCLSTAVDCAGTVVKGWSSNGTNLTQTSTGLTLVEGTTYYSCVRAFDQVGNVTEVRCSNGQTVDTTAPTNPTTVNDGTGADITWNQSAGSISANWTGGGDTGSGVERWEYCISTTTGCAGTVLQSWTSSGTTRAQTSTLPLVEGEQYFVCVRVFDAAGLQSTGSTCSDGQRVDSVAPPPPAEVNDGTGADIDWSNDATTIRANWPTVADPSPTTGVASGLQRFEYCITLTGGGGDCGGTAFIGWTSASPLTSTTLERTGLTLASGSTYFVCVRAFDVATNTTGTQACSDGVTIDTTAPTASWASWTDNSQWLQQDLTVPSLLWYNPAAPLEAGATATANVRASDGGAGMREVRFPDLAAGAAWGPGGTDSSVSGVDEWSWGYSFTGGGAITQPAPNNAVAVDTGGATTGSPELDFRIQPDGDAPPIGTITPLSGLQSSNVVVRTFTTGSDAASGVARYVMDYQYAPLRDGTCAAWDPWILNDGQPMVSGPIGNGDSVTITNTFNDVNADGVIDLFDSFCFRSRVRVFDHVGNMSIIGPNGEVQIDLADPEVSITGPADGSAQRATFDITGRTNDLWEGSGFEYPNTGSGIASVAVTYELPDGPDADTAPDAAGSACAPITTFTGTWDDLGWTCSWNTSTLPDGLYTVSAQARDRSGRLSAISTRKYLIDNKPPVLDWHSWLETSTWMHSLGTIAWVNPTAPANSYQLDARVTASDAGSGVDRVEFPALGTGWSPAGTTNATRTDPDPAPDAYTMIYTFSDPATLAEPGSQVARAVDGSGNPSTTPFEVRLDRTAPTGSTLAYPDGYATSQDITITFATGDDESVGSGFREWRLMRAEGTLTDGTCSAWTAYATLVSSGTGVTATGSVIDSVADSACYRYRLDTTDNVNNTSQLAGTQETKVDLKPPTGTLAITTGTNPQWQYLETPERLYVNTNAGTSGTFSVAVTGSAPSGLLDATFPTLAPGFSGGGVEPGPGPTISTPYSWIGTTGTPADTTKVVLRSNSLGALDLPFRVIPDPDAPTGATVSYAGGYTTSTTTTVDFTRGTDAGAGILEHQLEREQGVLADGACTWSGTWDAAGAVNGPLSVTDSTLVQAGCYRYRVRVTDRVGNVGYSPLIAPIMVDQTAPTATLEWIESGTGFGTAVTGTTIWYQPTLGTIAAPEQFSMRVRITDAESGPGTVTFPTFAGNWALGATTTNTDGATQAYDRWNLAAEPGAVTAIAANGAGLTATVGGTVTADDAVSSLPAWSMSYVHGYDVDMSLDATWTADNTDDRSGFAGAELMRRSWPFDVPTLRCVETTPFTDVSLGAVVGTSYTDTAVTKPTCYRYFIRLTDRADNVAIVWAPADGTTPQFFSTTFATWDTRTIVSVDDIFPPAPFDLALPTNPALPAISTGVAAPSCGAVPTYGSATPTFSWSASSDGESGLGGYRVHVDDVATATATVGATATSWLSGTLTEGAHALGVRAFDNEANTTDAGPAFLTSIRVDATPPTASLVSPAAGSWTTDTTPTLDWTAADANCLARVEVYLDDMTTPVAVASGSEGDWTPATALAEGSHQWKIVAIDTLGNRTTAGPVTFGVDITPPTAFSLTAPADGQAVREFVDVSWTASSDALSGLSATSAYDVYVDGVLRTTVGAGFTTARVTGITPGLHTVQVRARDLVGNTTVTGTVTITGFNAIPAPVLVSPPDTTQTNTVPVLDWDWPSDGGPAPTSYDVVLDGAVVGTQPHPTTAHTIADPGDGVHAWRIDQKDPYTGIVSSSTWRFNLDRTAPLNPGPLSRTVTTVSWPAPTDPDAPTASGIARQQFWIDDGTNPPTFTTLTATATSRDYGTLPDGIYTMWVRAFDRAGNMTDTPKLVVTNDSVPPTAFTLDEPAPLGPLPAITTTDTAPSCETVLTYTSATPTLSWQASSDVTSGLAGYDVFIDSARVATVGPTVTSYAVPTALAGGAHTWRVVARDNFGLSTSSTPSPMNVRVDGAAPTIAFVAPADNGFTADTTPTLGFTAADDNCAARVEVTLDGVVVAVTTPAAGSWTPSTALAEGAHTWSLRVFDSVGNVTSTTAPRTFSVDTTGPTAVGAIFPAHLGSTGEGMLTFEWSAGSDPAGVSRYDLTIDGAVVARGITTTTQGEFAIYAGAHTWAVRAYDSVGNSTLFNFSFDATVVPDTTAPNAFNLLSPADGATLAAGDALSWEPAWDFKGVTQYRVYVDGNLVGTTSGTTTSFTPTIGSGPAICAMIEYDPAIDTGCLTGGIHTNGQVPKSTTALASPASSEWDTAAYAGWSSAGAAHGFGDPALAPSTATGAGFDGDREWSAIEYSAAIPATGADLRFEHRYLSHMVGANAYDGMTVQLKVDNEGDGLGNDAWESTCTFGARAVYGTTLDCLHEVVEVDGGYNVAFGGPSANHPLAYQNGFSGDSGGMVQTRLRLSDYAGMNIQVRFVVGTDSCFSGMSPTMADYCTKNGAGGWHRALWRIDNVTLSNAGLAPGAHAWHVVARDAAGNTRTSTQTTWQFIVP